MSDRLFRLRLFSRVARLKSFSTAGRELGLSQPSASRLIAALEKEIGVALLTRTTRGVALTEAGVEYLARIEPILLSLEEADQAIRGAGELRGLLRVALPTSFAMREVVPLLPPFMARHSALRLSLQMSDQRQDLLKENIDVALRFGVLDDTNAVARRLGTSFRLLVAAPGYLSQAGTPESPAALSGHALLAGPPSMSAEGWAFTRNGRTMSFRPEPRLVANVNEGAVTAAVAGLGILSTGSAGCQAELASGALVRVLPEWTMGSVEIHALLPAGRAAKTSARAFVDYLVTALKDAPFNEPTSLPRQLIKA